MINVYKDTSVLVTGGAGFIGSHLVEKLVSLGAHVTVLDDFSTGSLDNLAAVQDSITLLRGSITNYDTCLEAARDKQFVFHLAAFISVPESIINPLRCHEVNVHGTAHMLEAARVQGVQTFMFSSSSAVYGNQSVACHETMTPAPTSPYGFSKLMGEYLCKQYATVYNLNTVITRYFNVFGNRQTPHGPYAGVVAQFKQKMIDNTPVTIYGNGAQQRDFVSVDEVVKANLTLASIATTKSEVFNIASGKSTTILELFQNLKKDFPTYTVEPQFLPARSGDIYCSLADCSKFKILQKQRALIS
jgi:UDP-glucose 4-epimerase